MRASWKGAVTFGLVTVPIKVYKATEDRQVRFNRLHAGCEARLNQRWVCSACGETVSADEVVRGYEYDTGAYVTFTDDELSRPAGTNGVIEIVAFHSPAEVAGWAFGTGGIYYLGPDSLGLKPFALLVQAMGDRWASARVRVRDGERVGILRPWGNVLLLEQVVWPDEIRAPEVDFRDRLANEEPSEREIELGRQLVESLVAPFDPDAFTDTWRAHIQALVDAKVAGEAPPVETVSDTPKVVDLMAALEASVAAAPKPKRKKKVG